MSNNEVDNGYQFEYCYTDFDTVLFRAATLCETKYIIVEHKEEGFTKRFSGVQKFYGRVKARDGGWIGEQNAERELEDKPPYTAEDFTITNHVELNDIEEFLLDNAMQIIDFQVGKIKKWSNAREYKLCIGGKENWRYDAAHILQYKGERKAKPIMFEPIRAAFLEKYKNRIVICEGQEADDFMGIVGRRNYLNFLKTGKWICVLSYIDKDLDMIISPSFNYDKEEVNIIYRTKEEAEYCFCKQLLMGDKATDNIQGLPDLAKDLRAKYEIKVKGVGPKTTAKLLEGKTSKEMMETVVEAYRAYYGDEIQPFTTFRGEVKQWNWLDYLRENALLLWMRQTKDEVYDIEDWLKELEIDYGV